MEYCSISDLSILIKKRDRMASLHPCLEDVVRLYPSPPGGGLHEVLVRHFLKQLTSALEFLRKDGLVHRDVKPQNLLLNPPPDYEERLGEHGNMESSTMLVGLPQLPVLKLADFGFAKVLPSNSLAETLCGSPLYMAPEILRYEKYDATADLWSVGTVAYEAIVGKAPFRAPNHVDLLRKIEQKADKIEFPSAVDISDDLKHLIKALLKRKPLDRMSFEELFRHPVITKPIPQGGLQRQYSRNSPRPSIEEARPTSSSGRAGNVYSVAMARGPSGGSRRAAIEREASVAREREAVSSSPRTRQMATPPMENSQLPFATHSPSGTPPALADLPRRYTSSVPTSSPIQERQLSSRPTMTHATTTPARDELVRRGTPMERVRSRGTDRPSPGSSQLTLQPQRDEQRNQQQLDRRYSQLRGHASRDTRGSADEDYVIVDKQAVQVNAFADELASARRGRNTPPVNPPSVNTTLARRLSKNGSQPSSPRSPAPIRRPGSGHRPTSSHDHRYGTSPSSFGSQGKSTLTKALELANLRLFGVSVSPPNPAYPPEPKIQYPASSLIYVGNNPALSEADHAAVAKIEESASRSDVAYVFAEVKYAQLLPSRPPTGLGLITSSTDDPSLELTPDATVHAAEECLVLFVKTLALLSRATVDAHAWWDTLNPRETMTPARTAACTRMNNVVQWMRERFNEVLEKAELVQRRIKTAQAALPETHPWHPIHHQSASSDNLALTTGATAEKLMYDRALEMSRASAVNELVGEDLHGCEGAYVTALRLLEAVLEVNEDGSDPLDGDDRAVIENCKYPIVLLQK